MCFSTRTHPIITTLRLDNTAHTPMSSNIQHTDPSSPAPADTASTRKANEITASPRVGLPLPHQRTRWILMSTHLLVNPHPAPKGQSPHTCSTTCGPPPKTTSPLDTSCHHHHRRILQQPLNSTQHPTILPQYGLNTPQHMTS